MEQEVFPFHYSSHLPEMIVVQNLMKHLVQQHNSHIQYRHASQVGLKQTVVLKFMKQFQQARRTTTFKEILKPKSSNSSKSNRTPLKFPHFKINSVLSLFSAAKSWTNISKRPRHTILTSGFKDLEIIYGEMFPLKMLLEATNNFSEDRKIETDQFGSTYRTILDDGREVAIKCADNDNEF